MMNDKQFQTFRKRAAKALGVEGLGGYGILMCAYINDDETLCGGMEFVLLVDPDKITQAVCLECGNPFAFPEVSSSND